MSKEDHLFWDFEGKRSEGDMCEACRRGDHTNCGMQTWCNCDCDPELAADYISSDGSMEPPMELEEYADEDSGLPPASSDDDNFPPKEHP